MRTITLTDEAWQTLQMAALRNVMVTAAQIIEQQGATLEIEGHGEQLRESIEAYMALVFALSDIPDTEGREQASMMPPAPYAPPPYCSHGVAFDKSCEHCSKPDPAPLPTLEDSQSVESALLVEPGSFAEQYLRDQPAAGGAP